MWVQSSGFFIRKASSTNWPSICTDTPIAKLLASHHAVPVSVLAPCYSPFTGSDFATLSNVSKNTFWTWSDTSLSHISGCINLFIKLYATLSYPATEKCPISLPHTENSSRLLTLLFDSIDGSSPSRC